MNFGKAKVRYTRLVVPLEPNGEDQGAYLFFIGDQEVKVAGNKVNHEVFFKKKINIIGYTSMYSKVKPVAFNFHSGDFDNLMTFLNAEKGNNDFALEYWNNNESELTKQAGMNRETLIITGKKNKIYIGDVYDPDTTVRAITYVQDGTYPSYDEITAIEVK